MKKPTIFIAILCLYLFSTSFLYSASNLIEKKASSTLVNWTVSSDILKLISGEFRGGVADFITLEVGAYLGTEIIQKQSGEYEIVHKKADWDYVERLLRLSMSLDPRFEQTYTVAQGFLPWDAGRVDVQNELLALAGEKRFWDWRPAHFLGFNTYYFLKDSVRAGQIFLEASKREKAPPFLAILGARLSQQGGATGAAITLLKSMLQDKNESDPGYVDMVDRLHALQGVFILEAGIKQYKEHFGSIPKTPEDLFSSGFLLKLPLNPYNLPFCIDNDGGVYFDMPNCKEKKEKKEKGDFYNK